MKGGRRKKEGEMRRLGNRQSGNPSTTSAFHFVHDGETRYDSVICSEELRSNKNDRYDQPAADKSLTVTVTVFESR